MSDTFSGLVLRKDNDAPQSVAIEDLQEKDLPADGVLIDVAYSTVNYKDGLAVTARAPIVRRYPMVGGIDLAGVVRADPDNAAPDNAFAPGDAVVINGFGLSETHWGGYAQRQRVPAKFLLKIPAPLSPLDAMGYGTAGYTAALCVLALLDGNISKQSPVLVTGASGGVGSIAVQLLAQQGFDVCALTGSPAAEALLKKLGASEVMARAELENDPSPLGKERWGGVVDSVGGNILANALAQVHYGGVVAACGLAANPAWPANVMPFILRNVRLQGIDSVHAPMARRKAAWDLLAKMHAKMQWDGVLETKPLADVPALAQAILENKIIGRVVIDVNA